MHFKGDVSWGKGV